MTKVVAPAPADASPVTFVFDGYCVMCSGLARYIAARDKDGRVRLVASQSPEGRSFYATVHMSADDPESNLFILDDGTIFTHADSSIRLLDAIGFPRFAIALMRIVPRPISDGLYRLIARNRFRVFGRRDTCAIVPSRPGPPR